MLDPCDDIVHEPDPQRERWRESYYFMFYDFRLGIGGYSGIGYRPSKGYSGSAHFVWGRGISNLVASEFDRYETHDRLHPVDGLSYECVEPFREWRVRFDGRLNRAEDDVVVPRGLVVPAGKDGREAVPVHYDLRFLADQPAYQYAKNPAWDGLFDSHIDEVLRVTGSLSVGDQKFDIDARGAKDHSWGVRDWARPKGWRWVDVLFEEGPQATIWRSTFDGEEWLQDGAIYYDGKADPVTAYAESVTFAPRERADRPDRFEFEIRSRDQVIRASAQVVKVVPLVFPIHDEEGRKALMWNDRTVFHCVAADGRKGMGTAEFQFRVPESGSVPRPLLATDQPS